MTIVSQTNLENATFKLVMSNNDIRPMLVIKSKDLTSTVYVHSNKEELLALTDCITTAFNHNKED